MNQDFCEYCHTPLGQLKKKVTVYRHRHGRHFIFQQVPARVCLGCGAKYFSAEVVQEMDQRMTMPTVTTETIAVPVIPFEYTRRREPVMA